MKVFKFNSPSLLPLSFSHHSRNTTPRGRQLIMLHPGLWAIRRRRSRSLAFSFADIPSLQSYDAALARVALTVLIVLCMFYDHQVRKSGEPETSMSHAHLLKTVNLHVETRIRDHGRLVLTGPETEGMVDCKRQFGDIMEDPRERPGLDGGRG